MGKKSKKLFILATVTTILFFIWVFARTVEAVSFDLKCTQYLKRAADANSVELAQKELEKSISYAESKNLTQGVVSIFLKQPKNDVGFWYENMVTSYEELKKLPSDASSLEKNTVLMKLRESLTDVSDSGIEVSIPDGISIYPNNILYCWWGIISFFLAILFWILWLDSMGGL